ncbi:type II toxin-antitoxin system VapC family toxin [Rhodoplanes azumiensis]|uniref:Ribonuclease VapC n=1 Tax=Rhodoplanes azumiensis TaxID=1897628 RepID=A0ABW5AKL8_9BRAD
MRVYLDASVLVAAFTDDLHSGTADALLLTAPSLVVSDFAAAEFASVIARQVRMQALTVDDARIVFDNFDDWVAREARRVEVTASDVALCTTFIRRLDLNLRAPDAINIAIAQRIGARLLTFDVGMEAVARKLGVPVLEHGATNPP